tara:strand:+ start:735 stop:1589 length:855 start_codon:yes stop_codon:yes gene_type:complete
MRIGIVGYGFVGQALSKGLLENVKVFKVDPKLNTSVCDLIEFKPEVIFICVPTPMDNDGDQDISILKKVLKEIKNTELEGLIVVKSTVHPGSISEIEEIFPSFIYNPEFLREKHANEDFINSTLIVFGGDKKSSNLLANIYSKYTKCVNKDYIFTDLISASLIKYAINSFLATKVIFFNEFHNLFNSINKEESWANFISYLSNDSRIGDSHMMVPGHDGRYGFGGACLPKDASAIIKFADKKNIELSLIKNVIDANNKIRSSYDSPTEREDEQNIKYNNQEEII